MLFKEGLKNREAVEGTTATLHCEMTKAGADVKWRKGHQALRSSDKYRMREEGAVAELLVRDLQVEDTGVYACVCGDQKTMATLTVHGKPNALWCWSFHLWGNSWSCSFSFSLSASLSIT